jgi:predicted transcriptional regulator
MNRSREQLLADILTATQEPQPITVVMYGARLSYAQLLRHMKFLENKGMIQKTKESKWGITDSGRYYLRLFEKIVGILERPFVIVKGQDVESL